MRYKLICLSGATLFEDGPARQVYPGFPGAGGAWEVGGRVFRLAEGAEPERVATLPEIAEHAGILYSDGAADADSRVQAALAASGYTLADLLI